MIEFEWIGYALDYLDSAIIFEESNMKLQDSSR